MKAILMLVVMAVDESFLEGNFLEGNFLVGPKVKQPKNGETF